MRTEAAFCPLVGEAIGEYLFIVLPLVALLVVHFELVHFKVRRTTRVKRLIALGALTLGTLVVWTVLEAGVLLILSFCSGCWVDTPYERIYNVTLGLPISLYYKSLSYLPDLGAWFGPILYGILPVAFVLFVLSLGLLRLIPQGAGRVFEDEGGRK